MLRSTLRPVLVIKQSDDSVSHPQLTMQQAVLEHFPDAVAQYRFNNRTKQTTFSRRCLDLFQQNVRGEHHTSTSASYISEWLCYIDFTNRTLKEDEVVWLKKRCPYFKDSYIEFLRSFRFKPEEQVLVYFEPSSASPSGEERGQISIEVKGLWVETILYEVPLMAALSDAYFRIDDTDWNLDGQEGSILF